MSDLIASMVEDLQPVKPQMASKRIAIVLLCSSAIAAIFMWKAGFRPDLLEKLQQFPYLLGLALYSTVFILAASLSVLKSFPSRSFAIGKKQAMTCALLAMGAVVAYAGFDFTISQSMGLEFWVALGCCLRISFGAIFPTIAMILVVRKLAPQNPRSILGYGWLSAAAAISIVSQLNCPVDDFAHIILGHGILLLGFGVVISLILALIVKWDQTRRIKSTQTRLAPEA